MSNRGAVKLKPAKVESKSMIEKDQINKSEDPSDDYFCEDPIQAEDEEIEILFHNFKKVKTNSHDIYFKPITFFRYLIIHLTYFFILGPFIIILSPIFGFTNLKNQGFAGLNPNNFVQGFQCVVIVGFLLSYYFNVDPYFNYMEAYMMVIAIFIRSITIACKYAYASETFLRLAKVRQLSQSDLTNENMLVLWRAQDEAIMHEELQAAALRLEIDSNLFFFEFINHGRSPELEQRLTKKKLYDSLKLEIETPKQDFLSQTQAKRVQIIDLDKGTKASSKFLTILDKIRNQKPDQKIIVETSSGISQSDSKPSEKFIKAEKYNEKGNPLKQKLIKPTVIFQEILNKFTPFLDVKQLEEKKLYGYTLLLDLIKEAKDARTKNLGFKILFISLVRAFIPTFYRIYLGVPPLTNHAYLAIGAILVNTFLFWVNTFILSVSFLDLQSRYFCLKQLGNLISGRKIVKFGERKLYPTINIFDPLSLRTWDSMRKVIMEYGNKFVKRNNFNIAVVMIFYGFVLLILLLQVTGLAHTYSDPLLLIIFSFETLVYFILFLFLIVGGTYINMQFGIHQNLLKKNKTLISDLASNSELFVGRNPVIPQNRIHFEGLRIFRKEFGNQEFEDKLNERCSKLCGIIDEIIEDLTFEQTINPFTVLGIPINATILMQIFIGIGTIAFAVIQSVLQKG